MGAQKAPMPETAIRALKKTSSVGGVPGLELMVSNGGRTRTWRVYYRVAGSEGRRRAIKLGPYPAISTAEARKRATEVLAQAADGKDPRSVRAERTRRAELTVAQASQMYLEFCAATNTPKTVEDKESAHRVHILPALGAWSLNSLKRGDVVRVLDQLTNSPSTRRNVYLYLHHFLAWAVERDLIDANPATGIATPKPVRPRDRVLGDQEIRDLWHDDSTIATIAKLALLTAQRRGSLLTMRHDELDLDRGLWTIAEPSKSKAAHVVPLTAMSIEIIRNAPTMSGPYVFGTGSDGASEYSSISASMRRLQTRLGNPGWRFHDLRRTSVTLAQRSGAPLDHIRALTQHKPSGVIGVYARHAFSDEKRQVVEAIERQIAEILSENGS